jgi:hypothetical protein
MQKGKLRILEGNRLAFFCPGCQEYHVLNNEIWQFNGNYEKPTFSPSVLITCGHYSPHYDGKHCWCSWDKEHPDQPAPFKCSRCHSFVRDGQIQFLSDCTHELAGKTVALKNIDEEVKNDGF